MDTELFDKIYGGDIGEAFGDNKDSKYLDTENDVYGGELEEIINIIAGYMSSDDESDSNVMDDANSSDSNVMDDADSNVIIGLSENTFDDILHSLNGGDEDNKSNDTFTFENNREDDKNEENTIDFDNMLEDEIQGYAENKLENEIQGYAENITLNKKDFLNYIKKILTYSSA